MAAIDNKGDEQYWIDGDSFDGIRYQPVKNGEEKFWVDGLPNSTILPLQNFDTGKFFEIFE